VERQKQAVIRDSYRAANQLRMAARRGLEWIGIFEALLVYHIEGRFGIVSFTTLGRMWQKMAWERD